MQDRHPTVTALPDSEVDVVALYHLGNHNNVYCSYHSNITTMRHKAFHHNIA